MKVERINILDSFRGIAILMVLFFHFFSRWTNLYPYQDQYDFFGYGKFGVHFFFMISGFVILFTLERTNSLAQFWFNRLVRLLPAMFFASVVTYLFFISFDDNLLFPTSHYFKNIVVSLTFVQPDLVSSIIRHKIDLDYISGSYWSLWVEIQFYVFASFFYFFVSKKNHVFFFTTAMLLVTLSWILSHIYTHDYLVVRLKSLRSIFNLVETLPYFCIGAVFYIFYNNNKRQLKTSIATICFFLFFVFFLMFTNSTDFKKLFLIVIFISLFLFMIYSPNRISFLNNRFLNKIGVSSYFLYLIHENIGVFLLHENYFQLNYFSFLVPIFYAIVLVIISILFTVNIEIKVIKFLKRLL
jgi:peptidoglycan/LPS O-acetylase OafA/YrhL